MGEGSTWLTFTSQIEVSTPVYNPVTNSSYPSSRYEGIVQDSNGNFYVTDQTNNQIKKIDSLGVVTTFAGSGASTSVDGTGTGATFNAPAGIAIDNANNIYVTETLGNVIRKISPAGEVTTIAGTGSSGNVDNTGVLASFNKPIGIAVDGTGTNLYVADSLNHKIRKIVISSGVVTTLAGSGTATGSTTLAIGSSGGTGGTATFNTPRAVVLDSTGANLYVADTYSHIIKKIDTSTQNVTVLFGSGSSVVFNRPEGITIDSTDTNLYISDTVHHRIKKVNLATPTSNPVVAGSGTLGTADAVGASNVGTFNTPLGLMIDNNGSIYVGQLLGKIRKIESQAKLTGTPLTANIGDNNVQLTLSDGTNTINHPFTIKIVDFSVIKAYATANGSGSTVPTIQDYTNAGVTGVTAAILAALNTKVASLASTAVDTTAKIQALVTALTPTAATPVAVTTTSSTINVTTTDGRDRSETGIKFDPSLSLSANGENERETRTNNRNIRGGVSTAGVLTTSIDLGGGVKSSLENQRRGSQTSVDANGNIKSVLTVDADNHLDTTLDNDGTVTHRTTAKGVTTEVHSSVKGATVAVDAQGTTTISSETQNNGFIYRAIISVALDGTAKSRIVKIDIATNNEIESMPTLVIQGSFESGNKIEAFELNNVVYVKVSTPLNNAITIK